MTEMTWTPSTGPSALLTAETERPSIIFVHTHIGFGSPNKQDTFEAHGSPLGEEEVRLTKQNLKWPLDPTFHVPDQALKLFRKAIEPGKKDGGGMERNILFVQGSLS